MFHDAKHSFLGDILGLTSGLMTALLPLELVLPLPTGGKAHYESGPLAARSQPLGELSNYSVNHSSSWGLLYFLPKANINPQM